MSADTAQRDTPDDRDIPPIWEDDATLSEGGPCLLQDFGGSLYANVPSDFISPFGLEKGTPVTPKFYAGNRPLVLTQPAIILRPTNTDYNGD